jgi:hypothetical protein
MAHKSLSEAARTDAATLTYLLISEVIVRPSRGRTERAERIASNTKSCMMPYLISAPSCFGAAPLVTCAHSRQWRGARPGTRSTRCSGAAIPMTADPSTRSGRACGKSAFVLVQGRSGSSIRRSLPMPFTCCTSFRRRRKRPARRTSTWRRRVTGIWQGSWGDEQRRRCQRVGRDRGHAGGGGEPESPLGPHDRA